MVAYVQELKNKGKVQLGNLKSGHGSSAYGAGAYGSFLLQSLSRSSNGVLQRWS